MKCSINAINMIKKFEGLRLVAYKCVSTEKKWTIGYGHYGVNEGDTITKKQADIYLLQDIAKFENAVNKFDSRYLFNQNQFDALVSFAFNVGSIDQLTHSGKRTKQEIADAIILYNKSGNYVLKGLITRRSAEQVLYNTPVAPESKSTSQLAVEVLEGKWGNGVARKYKLEAAGYNYKDVQKYVNLLLL